MLHKEECACCVSVPLCIRRAQSYPLNLNRENYHRVCLWLVSCLLYMYTLYAIAKRKRQKVKIVCFTVFLRSPLIVLLVFFAFILCIVCEWVCCSWHRRRLRRFFLCLSSCQPYTFRWRFFPSNIFVPFWHLPSLKSSSTVVVSVCFLSLVNFPFCCASIFAFLLSHAHSFHTSSTFLSATFFVLCRTYTVSLSAVFHMPFSFFLRKNLLRFVFGTRTPKPRTEQRMSNKALK